MAIFGERHFPQIVVEFVKRLRLTPWTILTAEKLAVGSVHVTEPAAPTKLPSSAGVMWNVELQ
jgi:hypothetical protein